ncbi:hypothetical protein UMM65_02280 [Aureibaculum sp. 2210JD6-5]|uniref:hypothetical protein n=1 Tax=Aureibaculum sp. 2210JD6-5 TaxID=3103957 RepID=UPI002AACB722|nr:hypothetical protein [Aureibaculum sp. 2210JD6-5]MDY7394053.1 hypothetical protein [Aureibaculum sp. 2210JD6-5]
MIQEVLNYKNILTRLDELISNSPYKNNFIIETAGMSAPTFYRKLKNHSFTVDEVLKILRLLRPEEASLLELKESIQRGKDDYKNGNTHKHQDVIDEIKKELLK